jgi:hypothetical protein
MIAAVSSVLLYYRAERIRHETYDQWRYPDSFKGGPNEGAYGIYSPYDLRWFTEDYVALACFVFALSMFLYAIWLRKSFAIHDSADKGDK